MTTDRSCLLTVLLASAALLGWATPVRAGWVWTAKTGWYNPARSVQSTPEELKAEADKAFEAKAYADAARGYGLLVEVYPQSPLVDGAYLQLLEAQFLAKRFSVALDTIEKILERSPSAETISEVVKRKYEIGMAYLTGAPRYFIGIPFSAEGHAVDILKGVVERFPYQSYSDDALFQIGGYYLRRQEYQKSQVVHERLVRDYPQSEWAGIAEYLIGDAALRSLKGVEHDFAPVAEAERRFERYVRLYPGGDKSKDAREGLARINRLRAERLLGIAKFYVRERRPKAASHYLQKVLKNHPDTEAARVAQDLLKVTSVRGG